MRQNSLYRAGGIHSGNNGESGYGAARAEYGGGVVLSLLIRSGCTSIKPHPCDASLCLRAPNTQFIMVLDAAVAGEQITINCRGQAWERLVAPIKL